MTSTSLARMLLSFAPALQRYKCARGGQGSQGESLSKVVLSFTATVSWVPTGPCMVNELLAVLTAASVAASSILPSASLALTAVAKITGCDHARDLSRNHLQ